MSTLTKTCSSCGLQKPLSAFLEMAGPQGATYGNICASCRKANRDKAKATPQADDETRSTSGFNIDSDTKAQIDFDKLKLRQEIEERYHEERDKTAQKDNTRKTKVQDTAKQQEKHRKSFLDQPYLDQKKKPPTVVNPNSPEAIASKEASSDMSLGGPNVDFQIAGKRKRTENPFFQAWLARIDKTSPIAQAAMREEKNRKAAAAEKNKKPEGSSEKDAVKYAENNWETERPKKRPRR